MRPLPHLAIVLLIGLALATLASHTVAEQTPCTTCEDAEPITLDIPQGRWFPAHNPYPCDQPGDVCVDWIDQITGLVVAQCCIPASALYSSYPGVCPGNFILALR